MRSPSTIGGSVLVSIFVPAAKFSNYDYESRYLAEFRSEGLYYGRATFVFVALIAAAYVAVVQMHAPLPSRVSPRQIVRAVLIVILLAASVAIGRYPAWARRYYFFAVGAPATASFLMLPGLAFLPPDTFVESGERVLGSFILGLWLFSTFVRLPVAWVGAVGAIGIALCVIARGLEDRMMSAVELLPMVAALVVSWAYVVRSERHARELFDSAQRLTVAYQRLASTASELQALVREKTEIVARLSHDVRQPLAILQLTLARLEADCFSSPVAAASRIAELRRTVSRVQQEVDLMLESEMGRTAGSGMAVLPVDVASLVSAVAEDYEVRASVAGVSVGVSSRGAPLARALTNQDLLRRVLANLVDNGIKYRSDRTNGSRVCLKLVATTESLFVVVADNGIGIAGDEICRLGEKGWRSPAISASREGYGLGVYLAMRGFNTLPGHSIRYRSRPGKGTVVRLKLPRVSHGNE